MIRTIESVDEPGFFQAWRRAGDTPKFKSRTIIYGENGSGKTTLSRLLYQASKAKPVQMKLTVDGRGGEPRVVDLRTASDPFMSRCRVFNQDYVEENLHFADESESPMATGLLTLGEDAVEARTALEAHREQLENTSREAQGVIAEKKELETSYRRHLKSVAENISRKCQTVGGRFDRRKYNATSVKQLREGERQLITLPGDYSPQRDLELVKSSALVSVTSPPALQAQGFVPTFKKLTILLTERLSPNRKAALTDLAPELAVWIQHGLSFHEPGDDCLFCSNPVADERLRALRAHFNNEVSDLQRRLDAGIQQLQGWSERADTWLGRLPKSADLAPALRDEYLSWRETASDRIVAMKTAVAALKTKLEQRRSDVFTVIEGWTHDDLDVVDEDHLGMILERHNAIARDYDNERTRAAERIESFCYGEARIEIDRLGAAIQAKKDREVELRLIREDVERAVDGLAKRISSTAKLAQEITSDLGWLLGRKDLSVVSGNEDGGYTILRDGGPAHRLSEGEKNAIALLHFLASLRQEAGDAGDDGLIVIIDDPVSSLDQNTLTGISTQMWIRLVRSDVVSQVIILTHNFELMRSWCQLLGTRGGVLELRATYTPEGSNDVTRSPQFIDWSSEEGRRRLLRSEYHYIFWRVATALHQLSTEREAPYREYEAAATLPNMARRLLEGYCAFRVPGKVGNVAGAVEELGAIAGSVHARTVVGYLHRGSHSEEVDLGRGVMAQESVRVLREIMRVMRGSDREHFDGMCDTFGLSPALVCDTEDVS